MPPSAADRDTPTRRLLGLGGILGAVLAITLVVGGLSGATGSPSPSRRVAVANAPSRTVAGGPTVQPTPTGPTPAAPSRRPVKVKIGILLPLTSAYATSAPVRDAVVLAVDDAEAIPGVTVETVVSDDSDATGERGQNAAAAMQAFVADSSILGVVGPDTREAIRAELPISNQASLLQCAPTVEAYDLSYGQAASALRPAGSGSNNLLRMRATDTDQAAALAEFGNVTLHATRALVVYEATPYGQAAAKRFADRWTGLKATVLDQLVDDRTMAARVAAAAGQRPDAVFFSGDSSVAQEHALAVRAAMDAAGLRSVPLLTNETVAFGEGTPSASYPRLVSKRSGPTYAGVSWVWDPPEGQAFAKRFKEAYGVEPSRATYEGYACAQVILEAIRLASVVQAPTRSEVRLVAGTASMDTILGGTGSGLGDDQGGGVVSILKADTANGEWTYVQPIDVQRR